MGIRHPSIQTAETHREFQLQFDRALDEENKFVSDLCSALPQRGVDRGDRSLREGVQRLIRTIEDDSSQLDSRVTKDKMNRNVSESEDERKRSIRGKSTANRSSKDGSDDDLRLTKPWTTFRVSYETFPEETLWSSSEYDDKAARLTSNSSVNNSTRKRDVSPLLHDTKPSTTICGKNSRPARRLANVTTMTTRATISIRKFVRAIAASLGTTVIKKRARAVIKGS